VATYVAAGTPGTTSATLPAGTVSGDWVIVFAYRSAATAPTLPANWTTITTVATNPAHIVAYRIYDGVWAMPTFTNATRCVSVSVRPVSGATLAVGVTESVAKSQANVVWNTVTMQVTDGTSLIFRGVVHTRNDVAFPLPTDHTVIDNSGTQPGYGTWRKTTNVTNMNTVTSTISRSTTYTTAQFEIKDVPAVTQAAYRFFDQGTETGSVALGAQNTAINGDLTNGDGIGALRVRLQNVAVATPATDDWQLQWEKNASGTWNNVGFVLNESYEGVAGSNDALLTTVTAEGQSFTGNGRKLSSVQLWTTKTGTPPGNITAQIYAHTGTFGTDGVPTGSPLATSTAMAATSVSNNNWTVWQFDGTFTLVNGVQYFVVLSVSTPGTAGNFVAVSLSLDTPVAAGNRAVLNSGVWSPFSSLDYLFRVYTNGDVAGYNDPSLTDGAATTNRLGAGTGSFVAGKISETGDIPNFGWSASNYTELLYSVQIAKPSFVNGDAIRFRVVRNGATTGMTFTQTPLINAVVTVQTRQATITTTFDFTGTVTATVPQNITATVATTFSVSATASALVYPPFEYQTCGTDYNNGGQNITRSFPSINWLTGDLLVIMGTTGLINMSLGTPTVAGLTFTPVSGFPLNATANSPIFAWVATAASAGSGAISITTTSNTTSVFGASLWHWSSGGPNPPTGLGNIATLQANTVATEVSLTTSNGSTVCELGSTGQTSTAPGLRTPAPSTGATERVDISSPGNSPWVCDWTQQPAGTRTYGIASQGGTITANQWGAIEVLIPATGPATVEATIATSYAFNTSVTAVPQHEATVATAFPFVTTITAATQRAATIADTYTWVTTATATPQHVATIADTYSFSTTFTATVQHTATITETYVLATTLTAIPNHVATIATGFTFTATALAAIQGVVQSTISTVFAWSSTATADLTHSATIATPFTFATTATATPVHPATIADTYTFSTTVTATTIRAATIATGFTWTTTATAIVTSPGQAVISTAFQWITTVTAVPNHVATIATAYSWTTTATAIPQPEATITTGYTFTTTASALPLHEATIVTAYSWAGTATLNVLHPSIINTTFTLTATATAIIQGQTAATISTAFTWTTTATAVRTLAATAAQTYTFTTTATAAPWKLATVTTTYTFNNTITALPTVESIASGAYTFTATTAALVIHFATMLGAYTWQGDILGQAIGQGVVLNDAAAVYLGGRAVSAVYAGAVKVWP
jgi:hypothetical protein